MENSCKFLGAYMREFTDKDIGRCGYQFRKIFSRGEVTAEDCPEIIRDNFETVRVTRPLGIRSMEGAIAHLKMTIAKRLHGESPITQRQGLTITPCQPCNRKPKSLLREIKSADPGTDRGNHLLGKNDLKGLFSTQEHCTLQEGGQASDMIDMPMRDEESIEISNQGSPVSQGMNTRFPRIDEQMFLPQEQKGTGEEAVGIGEAGTRSEKADRWHDQIRMPEETEKRMKKGGL